MRFLSKFLLKFSFIRFLRSFLRSKISPWLKYFYYIVLLATIASIPYLVSQNQARINSLKNKISSKYIEFIGGKDDFYNKVTITGNKYTNYDAVAQIVREEVGKSIKRNNYLESLMENIRDEIKKLPWVKNVVVSRNLPSDLMVRIEEYQPFAIWQNEKAQYVIDKDGHQIIAIKDVGEFPDLLILSGDKANLNVRSLFDILALDPKISQNVYSATWIGLRRWNIGFKNNLLVELPDEDAGKAWKKLIKIYNMSGSLIDLKVIDLRIQDKVYLEYEDESVKYLNPK